LLFFTWATVFLTSYFYRDVLLFLVMHSSMAVLGNSSSFYFIFTDVYEVFYAHVNLILFISLQILFLFIAYHGLIFLTPALLPKEYFYMSYTLKVVSLVWCFSLITAHFILIPLTWKFFLSFQVVSNSYFPSLYFEAKLSEYLRFYIALCYLCIFYLQLLAMLLLLLSRFVISLKPIKNYRKLVYYTFVAFSTVISPPDLASQLVLSSLLILVYELLVFLFLIRFFAE